MRPLTLKLNNFGPFLNETIDFDHVKDDQLFLISGKTGSGKTMIFDAIVYALFGEASTKDRKESDLRSHFADSKSPMVVEFEFKLRDDVYKIVRQGAFIKEGNKNKTLGQLTVYQFDNDDYDLKESKINTGNQFIKSQLGVNAEQFRQLFILPQGEFKRFLLSKSSEKQEILRTLFNSQRFEDIQRNLMDDVKEVREKIEKRFSILENNWQDIDAFNDEVLTEFKLINARQTNRVVEVLPKFIEKAKDIQEQLKQRKHQQQDEVKKSEKILDDNINLEHALSKLKEQQAKYDALVLKENDIQSKVKLLNEIYEVRPLANLLDTQETLKIKKTKITQDISNKDQLIRGLVSKIQKDEDMLMMHKKSSQTLEKTREFIERCKLFYDNANKYKKSYQEYDVLKISYNELNENFALQQQQFDTMNAQLNYRNPDYEIIEILNSEIFELKNKVKDLKRNELKQIEYQSLQNKKKQKVEDLKAVEQHLKNLENEYRSIDKTNIDLNNKKDIITKIQSALQSGDTCPVCGNEIHKIEQHLDFDELTERSQNLSEIERCINEVSGNKIKCESELKYVNEQLAEFSQDDLTDTNYEAYDVLIETKKQQKKKATTENEEISQLKEWLQQNEQKLHALELESKTVLQNLKAHEVMINDFENTTKHKNVDAFIKAYELDVVKIQQFDDELEKLGQGIQQAQNELSIEENSKKYLEASCTEIEEELENMGVKIDTEMGRIGFEHLDQVKETIAKINEKNKLEDDIETYNKEKQSFELLIAQLTAETNNRELQDSEKLKQDYERQQQCLEIITTELSQHEFKIEFNQKKINEIKTTIEQLEFELKEQQEVFQLAEILSGKNERKLTLENYVLIYYLERILAQANQRLALMTGERYQLTRREQISQGYSGLEIDVFDSHSNQARHITSLSGGETFQASLALALGLSEIVQQEAGGIALDSMFVDEGFGTLDQETLETALDTLLSLKSSGRMVGIISHVSELKQRIPLILEVETEQYQSTTQFKKQ